MNRLPTVCSGRFNTVCESANNGPTCIAEEGLMAKEADYPMIQSSGFQCFSRFWSIRCQILSETCLYFDWSRSVSNKGARLLICQFCVYLFLQSIDFPRVSPWWDFERPTDQEAPNGPPRTPCPANGIDCNPQSINYASQIDRSTPHDEHPSPRQGQ